MRGSGCGVERVLVVAACSSRHHFIFKKSLQRDAINLMLYHPPRASVLTPGCGAELGLEQSCPQGHLPMSPKLRMGSGQGGVAGAHKLMLESTAGRGRSRRSQQQTRMHPHKKRPRLILYPLPISAEQHLLHQGGQLWVE